MLEQILHINQQLRLYIYSFYSLNEAFKVFTKLSTQERKNLLQLKNVDISNKNSAKFYISFNQRPNYLTDLKYLQNFSNHYVFQQNPNQSFNITQFFNFFIESFPQDRLADIQMSFVIRKNQDAHRFDSIEILQNYHKVNLKKQQIVLNDISFEYSLVFQDYLLDTQEIHVNNSLIDYKLYVNFKEYEEAKSNNSLNLQTLRNAIFNSNQLKNLQSTKFVFKNTAIVDPKFIGNMVQVKNIQLINSCLHDYCVEQLLQFQSVEKLKLVHQSPQIFKDFLDIKVELTQVRYQLTNEEIINFKQLNSLTIQFNDIKRIKQLKDLLIANYQTNVQIKIIIGFQTYLQELLENCFFPENFNVIVIAPLFSISNIEDQNFCQTSYYQRFHNLTLMDRFQEKFKQLKCFEFEFIQMHEIPKSLRRSLLALKVYQNINLNIDQQDIQKSSFRLFVSNYLQLKAKVNAF